MPRFVILTHDHPTWHWDFMLEVAGVLRTWRLDSDPGQPGPVRATPLSDHRLLYLDYEGPVSNQRGSVQRWDAGQYELLDETNGSLSLTMNGTKLTGRVMLMKAEDGTLWLTR